MSYVWRGRFLVTDTYHVWRKPVIGGKGRRKGNTFHERLRPAVHIECVGSSSFSYRDSRATKADKRGNSC